MLRRPQDGQGLAIARSFMVDIRVEYELTDAGRDLYGALKELQKWAQHHA